MKFPILIFLAVALDAPFSIAQKATPTLQAGDRVAVVGNTFADQLRLHGFLETRLLQDIPTLQVRNLGWAGDTLTVRARPTNFPSEETTLTEHKTDVIIACFGMGESFEGTAGLPAFKTDLKAFIDSHADKRYNGKSDVRLILVSPIACEDQGVRTPNVAQRNRDLRTYTTAMKETAAESGIQFVDLFTLTLMREESPSKITQTTNGLHLNELGHWNLSTTFAEQLTGHVRGPWRILLDAEQSGGLVEGVDVEGVTRLDDRLRFTVTETTPPNIAPPADLPAASRDTLSVKQLALGSYTLRIDGTEIATATHDEWAAGVAIDASPAHREAEAIRDTINQKNLQYLYSWKALNQVHIVGERRKSASGRALPEEVKQFKQLAMELEDELQKAIPKTPPTRSWELIRIDAK